MQQLIQLRWIAVVGQIATIAGRALRLRHPPAAARRCWRCWRCLVAFNVASLSALRASRRDVTNSELFVALLVDVAVLTAQLYLSGGATNPFVSLYLLQVTLGAVLLDAWSTWIDGRRSPAPCFAGLTLFYRPLALPLDRERGLFSPYILGMLICFVLNAALLVVFITRINRNLRERDAHLADAAPARRRGGSHRAHGPARLRRRARARHAARHAVGDPRRLAAHAAISPPTRSCSRRSTRCRPQVQRCKTIVTGILLSAGEARGEDRRATPRSAPSSTTLVEEWRDARPARTLRLREPLRRTTCRSSPTRR